MEKCNIEKIIDKFMGKEVKDKITGATGTVTAIDIELYGCIQGLVTPKNKEDGTRPETYWYDVTRLNVLSDEPVMKVPDYNKAYDFINDIRNYIANIDDINKQEGTGPDNYKPIPH